MRRAVTKRLPPERAARLLERARTSAPRQVLDLALALLAEDYFGLALEAFELGRAHPAFIEAELPELSLGVASALLAQDDLARAEDELYGFVSRRPDSPVGHLLLARCHARRGRQEAALASVARALELDPNDLDALDLLYRLLDHADGVEAAMRALGAIATTTSAPGPWVALAGLALAAGDSGVAAQWLEQARPRLAGAGPELLAAATGIYAELGAPEGVIALLEEGAGEHPFPLLARLIDAYVATGEIRLARGLIPRLEGQARGEDERAVAARVARDVEEVHEECSE